MSEQQTLPELPQQIRQYLDGLTDEQRDRVITAEAFKVGGGYQKGQKGGLKTITRKKRVLMDLSFQPIKTLATETRTIEVPDTPTIGCLIDHATAGTSTDGYSTVGSCFDRFYGAYGDGAIRAIKTHAARLNKIELPLHVQQEEWEHAGAGA